MIVSSRGRIPLLLAFLVLGCSEADPTRSDLPQLAFVSDRSGTLDIYLTDIDTTFVEPLTEGPGHEYGLAWSPSGDSIAFVSTRDGGRDVYILELQTLGWTNLTGSPEVIESAPHFSEDGLWITYVSNRDSELGEVYVTRTDGSETERITSNDNFETNSRFSPDGASIVVCRQFTGGSSEEVAANGDIVVINLQSGEENRLTNDPTHDCMPAWSPDGSQIAFHSCDAVSGGDCFLQIMRADGTGRTVLVNDEFDNRWPEWSPDGKQVAYSRGEEGRSDIVLVDVETGKTRAVTVRQGRDEIAVWRPR